jgi:hypothetical protein
MLQLTPCFYFVKHTSCSIRHTYVHERVSSVWKRCGISSMFRLMYILHSSLFVACLKVIAPPPPHLLQYSIGPFISFIYVF